MSATDTFRAVITQLEDRMSNHYKHGRKAQGEETGQILVIVHEQINRYLKAQLEPKRWK